VALESDPTVPTAIECELYGAADPEGAEEEADRFP
jgi:hypothetical protein